MTEPDSSRKYLHEAHKHALSAAEIIHELLAGPEEVDQSRLDEATKALRIALIHLDPSQL